MNHDWAAEEQTGLLQSRLAALEAAIETPFIPGELGRWIDDVRQAYGGVRPLVLSQLKSAHPDQFETIEAEDPGLLHRVEHLKQEDEAIAGDVDHFDRQISQLEEAVANVESDEAKLRTAFDGFVKDMLVFIIRARKQEQSIRTWLFEALHRDRGTVD